MPPLPRFNNVPFSSVKAVCFLPSSKNDLADLFTPQQLSLPSFFDDPVFGNAKSYQPPVDFLSCPRRTSGKIPEVVYPWKLADWFYPPDADLPYVYEDARALYFCLLIPSSYLSGAFVGPQALPECNRKHYLLNLITKFDPHLVRLFLFISFNSFFLTRSSLALCLFLLASRRKYSCLCGLRSGLSSTTRSGISLARSSKHDFYLAFTLGTICRLSGTFNFSFLDLTVIEPISSGWS